MRSTRLTLAVTALSAVLALTACSDDGGDDKEPASAGSPSAGSPSASTGSADEIGHGCGVAVKLSGAADAYWTAEAGVAESTDSGQTVYEARHQKNSITIASATDDEEAAAEVTVDGATYTATGEGVEVATDGSGASVDAQATGSDGEGPHVIATFVCD